MLRWQALRKPPADYTVFVHVLDARGQVIEQSDSPPQAGTYPTSLWDAGEIVQDVHQMTVPPGATLEVGLYTQPDVQRLPARDEATGTTSDSFLMPAADISS